MHFSHRIPNVSVSCLLQSSISLKLYFYHSVTVTFFCIPPSPIGYARREFPESKKFLGGKRRISAKVTSRYSRFHTSLPFFSYFSISFFSFPHYFSAVFHPNSRGAQLK